jgi:peptidoglycan/LPS O-acetylase OafA/YrhL
MKRRFLRIFRLLGLLSFIVAVIAVVLVSQGDPTLHINMLIATLLGIFFTMLLGTSLMSLIFISAESGHDEAAGGPHDHKDKE